MGKQTARLLIGFSIFRRLCVSITASGKGNYYPDTAINSTVASGGIFDAFGSAVLLVMI